ncbi:hypothetical protein TNCT_308251 [Trichonephila clavata]|uniref:Uncharacterized protein n=1 Tax=Trichonephila clavata TaxID=2740835 RepID=A0A8X6JFH6_TRICU|nr:hypothetical protein TNCT_308251 [Trichonephila clavata]
MAVSQPNKKQTYRESKQQISLTFHYIEREGNHCNRLRRRNRVSIKDALELLIAESIRRSKAEGQSTEVGHDKLDCQATKREGFEADRPSL